MGSVLAFLMVSLWNESLRERLKYFIENNDTMSFRIPDISTAVILAYDDLPTPF